MVFTIDSHDGQVQKTVQWHYSCDPLKQHLVQMIPPTCDWYPCSQVAAPAVDPLFKRKRKGNDKRSNSTSIL